MNIETCKQLHDITEVFKAWVQKFITDPMIAYINEHTFRDLMANIMFNKMSMMEKLRYFERKLLIYTNMPLKI